MYKWMKRFLDIVLSLGLITALIIPMIIIAIIIKLETPGPAIFKQIRIGKNGKKFQIYKFRTMDKDNNMLDFTTANKITKVGKVLRNTSIDELPQIFNILKGDMSFIGPRPWPVEQCEYFTEFQKTRHNVLPGITGLAQTKRGSGLSIFDKIDCDLEYTKNFSFNMDMKVLFQTMKVVLNKSGTEQSKTTMIREFTDLKEHYQLVYSKLSLESTKLLLLEQLDEVLNNFEQDYKFNNIDDVKKVESDLIKKLQI